MNQLKTRPAESGALAVALATVAVKLLGNDDPEVFMAMAVLAGALPSAITYVVNLVRGE